jgi:hypothetical protein
MKVLLLASVGLLLSAGCQRESSSTGASTAAVAPAPPASSVAPAKARPWYAGTWSGTYDAVSNQPEPGPGALREWAKDDGQAAIGKGTLELTVDDEGVARGKASGPLGAHAVSGSADSDTLRLVLAPETTADAKSFRGAVVVKREGELLRGTLRAGSGDGATLRRAGLELRRQPPP